MNTKLTLGYVVLIAAGLIVSARAATAPNQPPTGAHRTFDVRGLTRIDMGGGAFAYVNGPGLGTPFTVQWNTGATAGSYTNVPVGVTVGQ